MHADDERFELYLKQFRPRQPEPLPIAAGGQRTRRTLALAAWAAAIIVIAGLLAANWNRKPSNSVDTIQNPPSAATADFHPLTIRTANELLERAPSVKAAMDELMLDSEEKKVPKSQSAFAMLSEENVNP